MLGGTGCDECAAHVRRECTGACHSTLAPPDWAAGHLGWLRVVLPPAGMAGFGPIRVGSGVGERILGREKESRKREREGGKRERQDEDIFFRVFEF